MTDAEIDALARDIIAQAVAHINQSGTPPFSKVRENTAGNPVIVYTVREPGSGAFLCALEPLDTVKRIIQVCEQYYDTFKVKTTNPKTKQPGELTLAAKGRSHWAGNMAFNASTHLIVSFRSRLWGALQQAFDDCCFVGFAVLSSEVGQGLTTRSGTASTDISTTIEKIVKKIADNKRSELREIINHLPNLIIQRTHGGAHNVKHAWRDADRACLARKYKELQPIWLDAKVIAKEALKSRIRNRKVKWRKEVLRTYPNLPTDLLDSFGTPRGGTKPSDNAIIHASRECHITPGISARRLKAVVTEWNIKQGLKRKARKIKRPS